jgi:hypothetical protein
MELLSPDKAGDVLQHDEAEPSCDDEDHGHDIHHDIVAKILHIGLERGKTRVAEGGNRLKKPHRKKYTRALRASAT